MKGRWRIVEMELWDNDAIELLGPAFIEIGPDDGDDSAFPAVPERTCRRLDQRGSTRLAHAAVQVSMPTVSATEARAALSELLGRVAAGEEVTITAMAGP